MCSLCRLLVAKNHHFGQILTISGAPVPTPFHRWEPNSVCYSRPMAYAYLPNFVSIGLFCRPLAAKNPNFCHIFDLGIQWCRQLAAIWESWAQMHNYKPSPIQRYQNRVCTPTRLHGEIGRTNSDVQKRDEQTDRQKTQRFWLPRRRVLPEPNLTWHGDRGPRARSCASKTFAGLTHSFAARGRQKFGGNQIPST